MLSSLYSNRDSTNKEQTGMDSNTISEVAYFRQRQASEEEAARRGLYGLAIVASHELITARMERGAERILRLITEGKHDEAVALMNTESWDVEVEERQEGAGNEQTSIDL
jgi:hypothetical protein